MVVEVLKPRGYSFGHRNNVGRRGRVWGGDLDPSLVLMREK